MKTTSTLIALAFLLGMSTIARAQDGKPFAYTLNPHFIDGEPNAVYTAGANGTATVEVGANCIFTVTNTDTRMRDASTSYSVTCFMTSNTTGKSPFSSGSNSAFDNVQMQPMQKLTYTLAGEGTGNAGRDTYTAQAACTIQDGKTLDNRAAVITTPTKVQ